VARLPLPKPPSSKRARDLSTPSDRKGDARGVVETPRVADRRAASGCLWDACEALLASHADPEALPRALDSLLAAFDCDGVALHAVGPQGHLEPWCARGDWQAKAGDLRECIGVPLFRGRERVGALDLRGRRAQRWTPDQQSLVRTAAGALGAALGARLELDRLRRAPGRDPVTGLADGKAFHQRLLEEFGRAQRNGVPLAVVTIDLDHFGALNDRYGKPSGDEVLAECALVLKVALRDGDFLARLSGDEFGIILPDCDLAPARRLAERLRHAIEEHRFARAGKLSCSAGVAATPRDGLDATELLGASEQALGLAKKAGRHRTASNGPSHTH
jgi:diguanylate cyclase (GGDEF)-like protein